MPETTKKEKLLAIFTTFFLLAFAGSTLFIISLHNKEKTAELKKIVLTKKIEYQNKLRFNNIHLSTSTLPDITSKSFLTMVVNDKNETRIINQKNSTSTLPIASITKLMVAVIATENTNLDSNVTATLDYIGKEESAFVLETNKIYKVKELIANALISSDNDSARLLSSVLGENKFIDKMNQKARELGMKDTGYINVTGLDPKEATSSINNINHSTVLDLANLLIYIKNKHPELFELTRNQTYNFCDINNYCKVVNSTDKLLGDDTLAYKIIGGKTGSTDLAGKNLALTLSLFDNVYLINIVLGSKDNFFDSATLINHVNM